MCALRRSSLRAWGRDDVGYRPGGPVGVRRSTPPPAPSHCVGVRAVPAPQMPCAAMGGVTAGRRLARAAWGHALVVADRDGSGAAAPRRGQDSQSADHRAGGPRGTTRAEVNGRSATRSLTPGRASARPHPRTRIATATTLSVRGASSRHQRVFADSGYAGGRHGTLSLSSAHRLGFAVPPPLGRAVRRTGSTAGGLRATITPPRLLSPLPSALVRRSLVLSRTDSGTY